jgi:type VI secretion system secreted protein Hcp
MAMSSNMYLKFEQPEVAGGSADPGHQGEIDVLSWSHGFTQPTGQLETSHSRLSFAKYLDVATNTLLKLSWSGKQIGKATITCFRTDGASGNQPVMYLSIVMEHVLIANYTISGGPGDIPVENITLDYGVIQYNYTPQKNAGVLSATTISGRARSPDG